MKKLTQMLALASVAALCLSTGTAQDNNAGPGGPGAGGPGGAGGGQGGQGGGRGGRGGQGGGNFDPAAMQQRMNDRVKTQFGSTDEEWKAIEPLVTKVNEARMASMAGMGRGMFGGGRNRGGQGGQTAPGGQGGAPRLGGEPSAEETALTDAVEKDASKEDLKAKMSAYRKAKVAKEAELKTAQENLKKVLTTKQEAIALQMGLVQ